MDNDLFPTSYPHDYLEAYKKYWSRANMPSADRIGNGIGEWTKTRHIRPPHLIMMRCINLYLDRIELTRRTYLRGRDERIEYVMKPHFRKWLYDKSWRDYLDAAIAQRDSALAEAPATVRRAFRASEHDVPDAAPKLRPWREIAAEVQARR